MLGVPVATVHGPDALMDNALMDDAITTERRVRGVSTVFEDRQADTDASVGVLVSRASEQVSQLVQQEMRLAQAEMTQKGKRFGVGGGLFGGAGVVAFVAFEALVAAGVAAVWLVLPLWASALVVAGFLLLTAGLLALLGKWEIGRAKPAAPRETIASVRSDVAQIREAAHR
ncbi:phage holin family protein [Streptomyces sp. NPDC058045]|uniref:phage holin family protein n=1 Tax=Streptomyces sp. NPDC058045 TaxID=3346311 RepID=UPI0036E10D1A